MYFVILTVLHILYSVVKFLHSVWTCTRQKCEEVWDLYQSWRSSEEELVYISIQSRKLSKIPTHIAVLISEERFSYCDLASIIVWCVAAGISFVSFYDSNGVLKKNEIKLHKALSERRKGHLDDIVFGRKKTLTKPSGTRNGLTHAHKLEVNLFCQSDGKGSFLNVAHELCQEVYQGELKSPEINQDMVNRRMSAVYCVPDPDLAICCGETRSTLGFCPWQIRLTEFLWLPSHCNMRVTDFVSLLKTYGHCEQRLGK